MKKRYKVLKDGKHQEMTENEIREIGFVIFNRMRRLSRGQLEFMLELLVFMYGGSEPCVSFSELEDNYRKNTPEAAKREMEKITKMALEQMKQDLRTDA